MLGGRPNPSDRAPSPRPAIDESQRSFPAPHESTHQSLSPSPIKFDWDNRWLNGEEYHHILTRAEEYLQASIIQKYPPKTHPGSTYSDPQSAFISHSIDGMIYLVEGTSIGSEFGFPRISAKKLYKWYLSFPPL